jgi:hypothetical protein
MTTNQSLRLPEEVINLMERFIQEVTKHNCAVMGMVYCTTPVMGIGMMRNTKDNPVRLWHSLGEIIEQAHEDGRIEDIQVERQQ